MWGEGTVTGGAVRVSTGSLGHGRHGVCGAQAAGNWAEGRSVSLHMHRAN